MYDALKSSHHMQTQMFEALKLEHWMLKQTLEKRELLQNQQEVHVNNYDTKKYEAPPDDHLTFIRDCDVSKWDRKAVDQNSKLDVPAWVHDQLRAYDALKQDHDALKLEHWMLQHTVAKHEVHSHRHGQPNCDPYDRNYGTLQKELENSPQESSPVSCIEQQRISHKGSSQEYETLKHELRRQKNENKQKLERLESEVKNAVPSRETSHEPQMLSQTYSMLIRENHMLKQAHAALERADHTVRLARMTRSVSPSLLFGEPAAAPRSPRSSSRTRQTSSMHPEHHHMHHCRLASVFAEDDPMGARSYPLMA